MTLWERVAVAIAFGIIMFVLIVRLAFPLGDPTTLIIAAVIAYAAGVLVIIYGGRTNESP